MVNIHIFGRSSPGGYVPPADTTNAAGGKAYAYTPEQALAQYACTGTLNGSFYTGARETLDQVQALCAQVSPEFIAATAVYARKNSFMKDMPALLLAILAGRCKDPLNPTNPGAASLMAIRSLEAAAPHVIDNGKMLRNFVQMVRSGQLGRKSFGSVPRRVVANYLLNAHPAKLFRDSVGNTPTLRDIIRIGRPKPEQGGDREKFFGYLVNAQNRHGTETVNAKGKAIYRYEQAWKLSEQPKIVQQYEEFKKLKAGGAYTVQFHGDRGPSVPDVDFRMLDSLGLNVHEWTQVAMNAGWHMTRMNLNTFKRHGVLDNPAAVAAIATKLRDKKSIQAARVFPYQLLTAFQNATDVPQEIRLALQDAMEIATENVMPLGRGAIAVDVSGSMHNPIMGNGPVPSKARCVDVAALVAAVLMRKEPQTVVLPFDTSVYIPNRANILNPRDSIMTLANQLAKFGGGGTNCALPLQYLIEKKVTGLDYVMYVSDSESWIDSRQDNRYVRQGSATMHMWEQVKVLNPNAKLICINVQVSNSSQAPTRRDILNIGGFSDDVFKVASSFMSEQGPDYWVEQINQMWDRLTKSDLSDLTHAVS